MNITNTDIEYIQYAIEARRSEDDDIDAQGASVKEVLESAVDKINRGARMDKKEKFALANALEWFAQGFATEDTYFEGISGRKVTQRLNQLIQFISPPPKKKPLMQVVGLINCCSQKMPHACEASKLYQGRLFKRALKLIQLITREFGILSAKHHLVLPNEIIEPYDKTISKSNHAWAELTKAKIKIQYPAAKFKVILSRPYLQAMKGLDYEEIIPKKLNIGEQINFIDKKIFELENEGNLDLTKLLGFGFRKCGKWQLIGNEPKYRLIHSDERENMLFGFIFSDSGILIGRTKRSFKRRMYGFQNPGPTQYSNIKENRRIKTTLLGGGSIDIYCRRDDGECHIDGFHPRSR
jgi:hypothetical protein